MLAREFRARHRLGMACDVYAAAWREMPRDGSGAAPLARTRRSRLLGHAGEAAYCAPFVILMHSHLGLDWGATAEERLYEKEDGQRSQSRAPIRVPRLP